MPERIHITEEPAGMDELRSWIESEAAKVDPADRAVWALKHSVAFTEFVAFIATGKNPKRVAYRSDDFGAYVEVIVRERT
jgi:hypothetical protein